MAVAAPVAGSVLSPLSVRLASARLDALGVDGMSTLCMKPPDQDGRASDVGEHREAGCKHAQAVVEHARGD